MIKGRIEGWISFISLQTVTKTKTFEFTGRDRLNIWKKWQEVHGTAGGA